MTTIENKAMSDYNRKIEDDYIWDESRNTYVPIIEYSTIHKPSFKELNEAYISREAAVIELYKKQLYIYQYELKYNQYKTLTDALIEKDEPSLIDIIWKLIKATPHVIKIVYYVIVILNLLKAKK
jgi:hypothetical protein